MSKCPIIVSLVMVAKMLWSPIVKPAPAPTSPPKAPEAGFASVRLMLLIATLGIVAVSIPAFRRAPLASSGRGRVPRGGLMSSDYASMDDVLVTDGPETETELEAITDGVVGIDADTLSPPEIIRVRENVYIHWRGVKSCNHTDRIQAEAQAAMKRWAAKLMLRYSEFQTLRYGHTGGKVRCTQYKDVITGKRSCGCSGSIACYIDFKKPAPNT